MAKATTRFDPVRHGFSFPNQLMLPFSYTYQLPLGGSVELQEAADGVGGGMCFAALDYYHSGEFLPGTSQVDEIDQGLLTYLWDRHLDSLKPQVVVKVLEWLLMEDRQAGLRLARYEAPKLRRKLDKGEPAVLLLVGAAEKDQKISNRHVVAAGYEYDAGTRTMSVSLYDPARPGEATGLDLSLARPSQGVEIRLVAGERFRGFFLVDYRPQASVPDAARPSREAPSRSAEVFKLEWPVDSRRVNQFFGENPETYKPFKLPGHEGLDLFAPTNANIYAAAAGEVTMVDHPKDHPYGLQVRLRHLAGGREYQTIYAHLSKTFVKVGQQVAAGERIGLADNTGNSFGSHLHLTLKIKGATTPGYPGGIVDPWPYLQAAATAPPRPKPTAGPLPPPSDLVVYTTIDLNVRVKPHLDAELMGVLPPGEALTVLGETESERPKIGQEGAWLAVQAASGLAGYVAAWFVRTGEQAFPPSDVVVYPHDLVNLRSGPATSFSLLGAIESTQALVVLGDSSNARSKIGRQGEWLQVQTADGRQGFVAAWLVRTTGQAAPPGGLVVYPLFLLNVRARPEEDANILTVVTPEDKLQVLGEPETARAKVGQEGQWLNVRTANGFTGYAAAWFTSLTKPPPSNPT